MTELRDNLAEVLRKTSVNPVRDVFLQLADAAIAFLRPAEFNELSAAALPFKQQAAPQPDATASGADGDLVERMLEGFGRHFNWKGMPGLAWYGMKAALAVARPIIEAEQQQDAHTAILEEGRKVWGEGAVKRLADAVRARLAQPKTVTDRVTISKQESGKLFVCVDGEAVAEVFTPTSRIGDRQVAEMIRLGLIAELQAGSGETK